MKKSAYSNIQYADIPVSQGWIFLNVMVERTSKLISENRTVVWECRYIDVLQLMIISKITSTTHQVCTFSQELDTGQTDEEVARSTPDTKLSNSKRNSISIATWQDAGASKLQTCCASPSVRSKSGFKIAAWNGKRKATWPPPSQTQRGPARSRARRTLTRRMTRRRSKVRLQHALAQYS